MITHIEGKEGSVRLERTDSNKIRITLNVGAGPVYVLGSDYNWIRAQLDTGNAVRMGVHEHQVAGQLIGSIKGDTRDERINKMLALEYIIKTCSDLADLDSPLTPEAVTTYKRLVESSDWAFAKLMGLHINVSSSGDAFVEIDGVDVEFVTREEEDGWTVGLSPKLFSRLPDAHREVLFAKTLTPMRRLMHDLGLLS